MKNVEAVPQKFISEILFPFRQNTLSHGYPKFSIIMPCFNHARYIERSILSVLNQEYRNFELIIVDGGSSDGTVEIIKKYKPYLAYWLSEPDDGQSDALNKGFALASGDIYGWLNSDDLYMPNAFEIAVAALSSSKNKKIVFGDWLSIDQNDHLIEKHYAFDFNLNHFKYEGFHINAQSMFWHRSVQKKFHKFDKKLYNTMDYQMILAFGINEGDAAFMRIPKVLGCFRRHEGQKTKGMNARVISEHRFIASTYGYKDKYTFKGKMKRLLYRLRRAYWYLKRGGGEYLVKKFFC